MITIEERFDSMQPAFDAAATWIVREVEAHGFAEYLLTPGDATSYPFIFLPPGRTTGAYGGGAERKHWLVVLAMRGYGGSYEWAGQRMHWDYCASKWCENNHEWTGRVVCALLNAIADLLKEE